MYRKLSRSEADRIERRLLEEMAERYGRLRDNAERARVDGKAKAIEAAKKNARGKEGAA